MWSAIDLLASEYGWSKREILDNVYPDELYYLSKVIKKRTLSEYRVDLAIAQNPFSKNPKELFKQFEDEDEIFDRSSVIDVDSVERFKSVLVRGSKFGIK